MIRTQWKCNACNECGVNQPCVLITLSQFESATMGRCPADPPYDGCKWKKISECEIPEDVEGASND